MCAQTSEKITEYPLIMKYQEFDVSVNSKLFLELRMDSALDASRSNVEARSST